MSCYLLKIEENTLFARRGVAKLCPDADDTADLYEQTVQTLEQAGFDQYEISNFARRGYESRHNRKYWRCEEYLGIGPGAHSYLEGRRFSCPADLASFLSSPLSRKDEGPGGGLAEETMLRLRLKEGISKEDFAARFDKTAVEELFQRAQRFQKLGLMQRHKDRLFFTTQGFLVSNSVLASLL